MVDWRMLKMRIKTCCRLHPLIAKMRITKDYKGLQKDCEDEDCNMLQTPLSEGYQAGKLEVCPRVVGRRLKMLTEHCFVFCISLECLYFGILY